MYDRMAARQIGGNNLTINSLYHLEIVVPERVIKG
jgi:hypothetical protein